MDTDFGFDDLWALLLLRRYGYPIAGVSLVAGNAPLGQVVSNAVGARRAYGFDWPVWQGAGRPMKRQQETARRIVGTTGLRSRGSQLPTADPNAVPSDAAEALKDWLLAPGEEPREILALGPLTNIAHLLDTRPGIGSRISRLVWMGGSSGAGNHTPLAEFNAVADAEALACVLEAKLNLDIVDLQFCRGCIFKETDMPKTDPLTRDLLGGYLDIALERGRTGMAIYDPLAALAVTHPDCTRFTPCTITVSTQDDETYGATRISKTARSTTRFATDAECDLARLCLGALEKEAVHGP